MTVYEMLRGKRIKNVYDRSDRSVLILLEDRTEIVVTSGIIRQGIEVVIKPNHHPD